MIAAIFAGDRRVWRWALLTGLPLAGLVAAWCIVPRPYYTGTNSVNALTLTGPIPAGQQACAGGLNIPAGTSRVELGVGSGASRLPALEMTMRSPEGTYRSFIAARAAIPGAITRVDFSLPLPPAHRPSVPASLCVRATGVVAWGITPTTEGIQPPLTIGGNATLARLAVWYLPRVGARRSYLSEAGSMFDRAALFAPGLARPWLFGCVLLVLLPAAALLAVRCLALAVSGGAMRFMLWVYVLAVLNGGAWAIITPAFQSPDEVDHFAYVQALVERGRKPTPYPASSVRRWSTGEDDFLLGTGMLTDHTIDDSRAPWLVADVDAYHRLLAATGGDPSDGGGNEGTSGYGPLYYLAVAPGYLLASGSFSSQLLLVRLFSALIGALAALFTYLLVRELSAGRTWPPVLAGLLVAFQPMYAFLSGTINNDIGIDAGAAAVTYLLVRAICRGIQWRTMAALGLLLGLLPFVKGSAFDLYPLTVVAVCGAVWRTHRRREMSVTAIGWSLLALVVPAGVAYAGSALLSSALTPPPPFRGATPVIASAGGALIVILHHPLSYLTYVWEMVLPRLPGMHPHFPPGEYPANTIFVRRGWGAFGWYDIFYPQWIYRVIQAAMLSTAVMGLAALWRHRRIVRSHALELALVLLIPIVVVAGFAAVFYTPVQRSVIAEHGRYAFPALAAVAALVVGALHAIRGRGLIALATGLLVSLLALSYASQLLMFTAFYA